MSRNNWYAREQAEKEAELRRQQGHLAIFFGCSLVFIMWCWLTTGLEWCQ